jgi:hypothetical protein
VGTVSLKSEAVSRSVRILRTAMGPAITGWPEDPAIVEIMLNPDGRLWIDRLTGRLCDTGKRLSAEDGERIVRLVSHHVGAEVHQRTFAIEADVPPPPLPEPPPMSREEKAFKNYLAELRLIARPTGVRLIVVIMARYFQVSTQRDPRPRWHFALVTQRHVAMYLTKKLTGSSLLDIARYMDNRTTPRSCMRSKRSSAGSLSAIRSPPRRSRRSPSSSAK